MSIKFRVIFGFLLAILLVSAATTTLTAWRMREDANAYFLTSSQQQLTVMDGFLFSFVEAVRKNVALLAASEDLREAGPSFPNFSHSTSESIYLQSDLEPEAASAMVLLHNMSKAHQEYIEIYAGFPDGNYATTVDRGSVPAGYSTSQRSWYTSTAQSARDDKLVNAYLSLTGEMVFAVTHKMRGADGEFKGVVGIDVSLKGLSDMIAQMSFGKTGYFMLIEGTGRILSDPKNVRNTGKVIGTDLADPGLQRIFQAGSGEYSLKIDGTDMQAVVLSTKIGWKLVALQAVDEIYARSTSAIWSILVIVCGLAVLMIVIGFLIVFSITKPMGVLLRATDRVASGDYSAMPEARGFYGELLGLYQSLKAMVQSIADNIHLAQAKTAEAEEKSRLAEKATREAEEAAKRAEVAKREGMLDAATRLEGMVVAISAAAAELSTQIEESDRGATESSARLSEAATAMNEMNASVQEVAKNASSAAQVSVETRHNAEQGQQILEDALKSINDVQNVSLALKDDMSTLYEHTRNISRIMDVISDIADQTNLLALNAAIEAARAGEA